MKNSFTGMLKIAASRHKVLGGHKKLFKWNSICQQAFDALKSKLRNYLSHLGYPEFTCTFILQVASYSERHN